MKKINVDVSWSRKNYVAVIDEEQRRRIVEGIQSIGRECLAICG